VSRAGRSGGGRPVEDALEVGEWIASRCTRLITAAWSPTGRPVFLAFALGGLLVAVSFDIGLPGD
jgi:hypothetical protein